MKILKEVLAEIKPPTVKSKEIDGLMAKLRQRIKKLKLKAKVMVGGSFAKGTFMKEDYDIDIFVLFSKQYADQDLSTLLAKVLKNMKTELMHGSRDYFRITNGYNFEIVPVLEIKKASDAQNVTDFSPGHVAWVLKHGKRFRDDIRLAKKFCKAMGVYGAESYIHGFSGHVIDILVIHYKGFIGLMKAAARWKEKHVVDFNNVYGGRALFNLNKSKTAGPLIVIDPVQPDRNAAAAVDLEKFMALVHASKAFLRKPSKAFFEVKEIDLQELRKKKALILEVKALKGKEDVVGAKLLKAFTFLKKGLASFGVKDAGWTWDKKQKAMFWFVLERDLLPEMEERTGPPISQKPYVQHFKKKYAKTFTKAGRVYAKVKCKQRKLHIGAKALLQEPYFKEKIKGAVIE